MKRGTKIQWAEPRNRLTNQGRKRMLLQSWTVHFTARSARKTGAALLSPPMLGVREVAAEKPPHGLAWAGSHGHLASFHLRQPAGRGQPTQPGEVLPKVTAQVDSSNITLSTLGARQ